jgi:branched-chain amino acid transport system permease protein
MMNPIKAVTEKIAARGDTGPKPHAGALIALLAIACVVPFFLKGYHHLVLTQMLVYAIAILGLNILTGYNGQISLGHGAFYAIGAYTAAIMMDKFDLPYWSTVPAAGAICLGVGFLFGLPALRLAGHYFGVGDLRLGRRGAAAAQIQRH